MIRSEIRDGLILLCVALLEGSLILGGRLSATWAIGVTVGYAVFLLAWVRGIVRRRRTGAAE
ncbi:hypothetical protein [Streptomyces sp. NPDC048277]|uniref:hypothetical protein n=1 Tax=Streptomyces sp. NPDC048277 TaxID=3155027 RepID=UPI0033E3268D